VASTTWYYYSILGNPTWIVTKQAGSDDYSATRFGYAKNGETVTLVLGETWTYDDAPDENCPVSTSYDITFAREYRYDSGRARYLDRELDTDDLPAGIYTPTTTVWSDYDGDEIHGDYTVDTMGADTDVRSFEPGLGTVDPWEEEGDDSTTYVHSDHLGTLREASGDAGASLRVFTAFGEPITSQADRYGYVGAWGYQSHDGFPYQHVGARNYDPATGRFLQRDPIGFRGTRNVYAYVGGRPTGTVDPSGLVDANWEPPWGRPKPAPFPAPPPDLKTPGEIAEEVYAEGVRTDKSDTWMHFVASCRITSEVYGGFLACLPGGLLKEILDNLGGDAGGFADTVEDLVANGAGWSVGAGVAVFGGSCQSAAARAGIK
jgi:RHS repeat-associated protein